MEMRNFGANLTFHPQACFAPRTVPEVLDLLRAHRGRQFRVAGRLHSWSEAPRGDDVYLDLRHLNAVHLEHRSDGVWAVMEAGCQIKKAVAELQRMADVTLPSLGLITEQTIAGAAATGTHGSGRHSLSHYVDELTIASYDPATGEPIVRTIAEGDELRAARCSLGCLGIVLAIGIRCRPQYHIEEHFRDYDCLDDVLAAEAQYPLQQFYLMPFQWRFLAQHRRESDCGRSWLAPLYQLYWYLGIDWGLHLVLLTFTRLWPSRRALAFFYRWIVPIALFRGWKVVDRSERILTMEHELFRHIEIEIFVRRTKLGEALRFVQQLLQFCDGDAHALSGTSWQELEAIGQRNVVESLAGTYTHHYAICVRKVLCDDTLISMASGTDDEAFYALSFICYYRPEERAAFLRFAGILANCMVLLFDARPHWGKVFPIDAASVEKLYPRLDDFRRLCKANDPTGAFRNAWATEVLKLESGAEQERSPNEARS